MDEIILINVKDFVWKILLGFFLTASAISSFGFGLYSLHNILFQTESGRIIECILFFIISILNIIFLAILLRKKKKMNKLQIKNESPISTHIEALKANLIDGFLDGLQNKSEDTSVSREKDSFVKKN